MASVTLRNEMVSIIPGTSENHRPKPGAGAYQNDCGILPSEWYRISASITDDVPWGYICGYPTERGMYTQCSGCPDTVCVARQLVCLVAAWKPSHLLFDFLFLLRLRTQGDLYGGAHYSRSGSASLLTLQGKAILDAAEKFGDGKTLPFTPCKKGYVPVAKIIDPDICDSSNSFNYQCRYACPLHDKARRQRFHRDGGPLAFRKGEVDLTFFWKRRGLSPQGNEEVEEVAFRKKRSKNKSGSNESNTENSATKITSALINTFPINCTESERNQQNLPDPTLNDGL